jgi:hypothetical protein
MKLGIPHIIQTGKNRTLSRQPKYCTTDCGKAGQSVLALRILALQYSPIWWPIFFRIGPVGSIVVIVGIEPVIGPPIGPLLGPIGPINEWLYIIGFSVQKSLCLRGSRLPEVIGLFICV